MILDTLILAIVNIYLLIRPDAVWIHSANILIEIKTVLNCMEGAIHCMQFISLLEDLTHITSKIFLANCYKICEQKQ